VSSGRVGGAEQHVLWLAAGLGELPGFEAAVACRPGPIAGRLRDAGVPVHELAFGDGPDLLTPWRLARLARRFDVLHAHMNRASLYTRMAAALAGRPWVSTAHGMTKGFYYLGADRVVCVSQAVQRHMEAQGVGPCTTILNAIPPPAPPDLAELEELRRLVGGRRDRVLALVLANFHPNKGQELALQALRDLPERYQLLLAGAGELPASAAARIAEPALAGRVFRVGVLSSAAAPFEVADLVLVPSRREAFSLVAAEARVRGVPVIAADVDGLREVVPDEAPAGLRVPGREPAAWAAAIREVGERLPAYRERARRGAAAAREAFSLARQVRATAALLGQVARS